MESPGTSPVQMEAAMVSVRGNVWRNKKQTLIGDHQ